MSKTHSPSAFRGRDREASLEVIAMAMAVSGAQVIPWEADARPAETLLNVALTATNANVRCDAIRALQFRGTREVMEMARTLCSSHNAAERLIGVDLLGQLGVPKRAFPAESSEIVLDLLSREADPGVLSAACIALGHLGDAKAIQQTRSLARHRNSIVRYGVVFALSKVETDWAIRDLIRLSADRSKRVRNWATFALGSLVHRNTARIREALWRRVEDTDREIRSEAILGLAIRGDTSVVEPLMRELAQNEVWDQKVEAAKEIADERLLPHLTALKQRMRADWPLLDEAIHACQHGNGKGLKKPSRG